MSVTNRIIYSNNGVFTDLTKDLNRYQVGTSVVTDWIATQDYLYMGALAPFNHFYVKATAPSVVASNVMSIEYWDGTVWVPAYKVDDETVGLTKSGYITFFPDKQKGWSSESTNDRGDQITGLTGLSIYDMYWMRVKLSLNIPLGFTLSWVGQIFSDDNDLASEFPDLVRAKMLLSFGALKTDWEEQHVKAAELIVQDLISSEVISWKGQLLVREEFTLASIQKVAQLIYNALGDDYLDQRDAAASEYKRRLDKSAFRIDNNSNALLSPQEAVSRTGFMSR